MSDVSLIGYWPLASRNYQLNSLYIMEIEIYVGDSFATIDLSPATMLDEKLCGEKIYMIQEVALNAAINWNDVSSVKHQQSILLKRDVKAMSHSSGLNSQVSWRDFHFFLSVWRSCTFLFGFVAFGVFSSRLWNTQFFLHGSYPREIFLTVRRWNVVLGVCSVSILTKITCNIPDDRYKNTSLYISCNVNKLPKEHKQKQLETRKTSFFPCHIVFLIFVILLFCMFRLVMSKS